MSKAFEMSDVEKIVFANHVERRWRDKVKEDCRKERERVKREHTYKLIREIEAAAARIAYIMTGAASSGLVFSMAMGSPIWIAVSAIFGVIFIIAATILDKEAKRCG